MEIRSIVASKSKNIYPKKESIALSSMMKFYMLAEVKKPSKKELMNMVKLRHTIV